MRLYRRQDAPGAASVTVYLHGGGMFLGSLDTHDTRCRIYARLSGAASLSVGYRLAPEHPHPVPMEDCYAVPRWATAHAADLGIDPARIAVRDDSAGGGLAAAVALLSRDRRGPVELIQYPAVHHAFDTFGPGAAVSRRAVGNRVRALSAF
ncbi:alpha/beta hydrolase fold domain-containing protein [Streptomyces sp. NPDC093085]|uniref:alpha/beta hydrolase n=1 Tax=Streptomyces sp. NPDC093085 TaxID=3155068 RepID=UPI003442DF78